MLPLDADGLSSEAFVPLPVPRLVQVEIRQQLSPMFRFSQALLDADGDASRAADALDAATGLASNGFEQLARRPGGRAGPAAAAQGGTARGGGMPPVPLPLPSSGGGQQQQHPQQQQLVHQAGEALQQQASLAHAASAEGGACSAEEVDSLVVNAKAAAERAQSAIADLASPPRQHIMTPGVAASVRAPAAAAVGGAGGVGTCSLHLQPLPQQLAGLALPAAAADVEGWLVCLRQHSEALIRCARGMSVAALPRALGARPIALPYIPQAPLQFAPLCSDLITLVSQKTRGAYPPLPVPYSLQS